MHDAFKLYFQFHPAYDVKPLFRMLAIPPWNKVADINTVSPPLKTGKVLGGLKQGIHLWRYLPD